MWGQFDPIHLFAGTLKRGSVSTDTFLVDARVFPYLAQRLIKLLQDTLLIEHFALVSVLVVVMDFLPEVSREFMERHVLLHLFVLKDGERERGEGGDGEDKNSSISETRSQQLALLIVSGRSLKVASLNCTVMAIQGAAAVAHSYTK